jgi:FHS family glucose/mannose:H+ symporter-like MFS transporter
VPYLSFASNYLWVLVIGLLGPSVPAILADLGIGYAQAGLFFTLLSLGSLFGTFLGGLASDALNRKSLFAGIALALAAGLVGAALAPSYGLILAAVFAFSLFGSPAGTVGQSVMLDLFPERRERLLALMTLFGALGSFTAPLLVSVNYAAGLGWRWPFAEVAGLALLLFAAILFVPLPPRASGRLQGWGALGRVLAHPRVLACAALIFFSVAPDLGFSFWLAEHFRTELKVDLRLASAVVSVYLIGMMAGRLGTARLLRRFPARRIVQAGLALGLVSLAAFLAAPWIPFKVLAILAYGLGGAPVFPMLMATGTAAFPDRPGAVSGALFASVSLGGMVFPIVLGAVAAAVGIRLSYLLVGFILAGLLLAVSLARRLFNPEGA